MQLRKGKVDLIHLISWKEVQCRSTFQVEYFQLFRYYQTKSIEKMYSMSEREKERTKGKWAVIDQGAEPINKAGGDGC